MKRLAITVLAIVFTNVGLRGQTPDPLSFFPHHLGDIWEYVEAGHPEFYWQNVVLADSLGLDGRYYIQTSQFGNFIVDTTQFLVYNIYALGQDLVYKLDASVGDYWIVWEGGGGERHTAIVVGIYQTFLFGVGPVTVKVIDNYNVYPLDSLLTNTDHIAEGFGLIQQDFDGMPGFILRGAKIDGIVYGTVTSFEAPVPTRLPQVLRLDQNFPNPFNPITILRYQLANHSDVELTIYDIKGQRVGTLIQEHQQQGEYEVHFDARGLASGTYIYVLNTSLGKSARKMLLLK